MARRRSPRRKARKKRLGKEERLKLQKLIAGGKEDGCVYCGENSLACLTFHHIDPEEKTFSIGRPGRVTENQMADEISKCVCLCENCHRKLNAGEIFLTDEQLGQEMPEES